MAPHLPLVARAGSVWDAARAARVWDVVLDAFVSMGASRTSVKADAWRLQHDPAFHHEWAVLLPVWSPSLAYYDPVVTSSFPDADELAPVAEDEEKETTRRER